MAVNSLLLWAVVSTALAVGFIAPIFVIPSVMQSLVRYRLWRLRDELVDRLYDGTLPDKPAVRALIDMSETVIRHADKFHLLSIMIIIKTQQPEVRKAIEYEREEMISDLSIEERASFDPLEREFSRAVIGFLARGSIFGLTVGAYTLVASSLRSILRRETAATAPRRGPKQIVFEGVVRIVPPSAAVETLPHDRRDELAACVS